MLYPVCSAVLSQLRDADKHEDARFPGREPESPSKLHRTKPGFWTRKLRHALDVEKYDAARGYSSHDAGVSLAQGMPRGEKGADSHNSGDRRSAEVVTTELSRELSTHCSS